MFEPGDRVRGSAEARASGPVGPGGELRSVKFEGVVTALQGEQVLVRVGRTDIRVPASALELVSKGQAPQPERAPDAAPQSAASVLDKFLSDARGIRAKLQGDK